MEHHELNLNLYYWLPFWGYRVPLICSKMEGWTGELYWWFGKSEEEKHITASEEPSGLHFEALMEKEEWEAWIANFKCIAQKILGYRIGEIELGEVGIEPEWINPKLKVFEEVHHLLVTKDPVEPWNYFKLDRSALTELDLLDIEQSFFRRSGHQLHDELASGFQYSQHPSLSAFLYERIKSNEIPEFDYKPVSRKAVWALADIGTDETKGYLKKLAVGDCPHVKEYAEKRLNNWENELKRKVRRIPGLSLHGKTIRLEGYHSYLKRTCKAQGGIWAYQSNTYITLYHACDSSFAHYAINAQKLKKPFFGKMPGIWLMTDYLAVIDQTDWATNEKEDNILAMHILKTDWTKLLDAVFPNTSNTQVKDVQVEWISAKDPEGNPLPRQIMRLQIEGQILKEFSNSMIKATEDITPFIRKQKLYVELEDFKNLEIPMEEIYEFNAG